MTVQGGNSIDHGALYEGMLVDGQLCNKVSKLNTLSTVIPFGRGVVTDGDAGARTPLTTSTAAQFVGVVKRELNRATRDGETSGAQPDYDMTVVTRGVVAVTPTVDVNKDDSVYLIVGTSAPGQFTNVAGSGATAAVQVEGAKWLTTVTGGTISKISIGFGG